MASSAGGCSAAGSRGQGAILVGASSVGGIPGGLAPQGGRSSMSAQLCHANGCNDHVEQCINGSGDIPKLAGLGKPREM